MNTNRSSVLIERNDQLRMVHSNNEQPDNPLNRNTHFSPKILLVEDHRATRQVLAEGLRRVGFHVREAYNGQEGFRLLRKESFHVVVTDYKMPMMDGITMIKKARAVYPRIPIILMTGDIPDDSHTGAGGRIVSAVLQKPFRLNHLHRIIIQLLGQSLWINPPAPRPISKGNGFKTI